MTVLTYQEQLKHEMYMRLALSEASRAKEKGEVPIGAVVVYQNRVIAKAHNLREITRKANAHAELLAIELANQTLDRWRLEETTLYVTLEPCAMCSGAIVLARIPNVVYGARDKKAGCAGSLMNLLEDSRLNHRATVISGILEEECSAILSNFFKELRQKRKRERG